jgi:aminoglycoside 6'-N-acetyltransferase I
MNHDMTLRRASAHDLPEWLRLRWLLWPYSDQQELLAEMESMLADPLTPVFVAARPDGSLGGFLEAGLRKYADGCSTSPVGYIEGWYVDEDLRRQGMGAVLVAAAESWAREQGCSEMASDTWLDNEPSISAHLSLGYEECERLVHFCKKLLSRISL